MEYKIWSLYGYDQVEKPCIYKKIRDGEVVLLVLYVDETLLIGIDISAMSTTIIWLLKQFDIKHLGEANYVHEL